MQHANYARNYCQLVIVLLQWPQPGPEPAILDWYGHPTDLRERSSPARGVWGHAPPGKFGNRDVFRSFLVQSKSVLAVSL